MAKTKRLSKKERRIALLKKGFEDDMYLMSDWKYDVANGDTKFGYVDWVLHNIESHENDPEEIEPSCCNI